MVVIAVGLIGYWLTRPSPSAAPPAADPIAVVDFVIDGDTVVLRFGDVTEHARLIGIDTPETVSRSVPVQCYGAEASNATKGLLPPGTEVSVTRDVEARDRYGRLLVYLHRSSDDLFINLWLVENGFADVMFFEPNTTLVASFESAKRDARANGVGLWGSCEGPDQPLTSEP